MSFSPTRAAAANKIQVAYLMADISNVQLSDIKEISDSLEALSCKLS
jgi:D-3-phosphoglycerate dehydrogenase